MTSNGHFKQKTVINICLKANPEKRRKDQLKGCAWMSEGIKQGSC